MKNLPQRITIFGGSGFLGRHVVRALAKRGYRVLVACRRPDLAQHLQPLGDLGQIRAIQANVRVRWSVDRAVQGADAVINLTGTFNTGGRNNMASVQDFGARAIAEAA
ncbi:MAG: SDR family NAD(P)-dependent oxidoreductase, partial [Nitratireductor sp.]|nr:SDR family NAD(P)-dependent oxidoreductase [Nitratireductor sp.]